MRLAGVLGLGAAAVGCSAEVTIVPAAEESEPEACPVEPVKLHLPRHCWEDFDACPAADEAPGSLCTRRYVCEVEGEPTCVRAVDCACMHEYAAECSAGFDMPKLCLSGP
jgi:hypothetical protein